LQSVSQKSARAASAVWQTLPLFAPATQVVEQLVGVAQLLTVSAEVPESSHGVPDVPDVPDAPPELLLLVLPLLQAAELSASERRNAVSTGGAKRFIVRSP
jgi:hypothetical protein